MARREEYPVQIRPLSADDGGGWLAEAPDLPGCLSDGETPEEALRNVWDAIDEWIDAAEQFGDEVPEPGAGDAYSGRWVQRVPRSLHAQLAAAAKREGVSLNALATTYIAQGLGQRPRTRHKHKAA